MYRFIIKHCTVIYVCPLLPIKKLQFCITHILMFHKYIYYFILLQLRHTKKLITKVRWCIMETLTYPWSCSFGLTRGARRKPIIGNTGPSFGCTVKQIFNEIFFLALLWEPTGANRYTKKKVKRGKGRKRSKEKNKENSLSWSATRVLPDVGRGIHRGQGSTNLRFRN